MSLSVLNVAFPFAPVGPDAVGGAEQVLTQLDAALVRAGHESIVVACEGSRTDGVLVSTPRWTGYLTDEVRRQAWAHHRAAIRRALGLWAIDVVHLHGIDFSEYLPPPELPALVTLHLPCRWYPPVVFQLDQPNLYLHCVSRSQHATCPKCANLLAPIENGVDTGLFSTPHARRGFALALGRICPEKGFHLALDAAARAGVPLLLGGRVFPYPIHEAYFQREIVPRLDRNRRFLGPLDFKRKRRFLSAARCLLVPSQVAETSSLVALEAMACGTPVIAFPNGALAEIVEHGVTGFLVGNEREMAEAVLASSSLSPERCRARAATRYGAVPMIEKYLAVYQRLANHALEHASSVPWVCSSN